MSTHPHDLFPAAARWSRAAPSGLAGSPPPGRAALADRWAAVHAAAAVVAALAGRSPEPVTFASLLEEATGPRLAMAGQGLDDLSAILEIGLRALLAVHARGASPRAAAEALWSEFEAARDAVLALAPPEPCLQQ